MSGGWEEILAQFTFALAPAGFPAFPPVFLPFAIGISSICNLYFPLLLIWDLCPSGICEHKYGNLC